MIFLNAYFLWLLLPLVIYLLKRRGQVLVQKLRWLALFLLIVALARPVVPQEEKIEEINAQALTIAFDLSASMSAKDILPSRIEATRATIKHFLELNKQEKIALIAFTTNPLLLSPFTTDHALVVNALESIRDEYLLTKGTNLKKLFEKVAQFDDKEKKLVLFTDGGDEHLEEALVSYLKEQNIELFVVAMATQKGATVERADGSILKDKEGHLVISKLNSSLAYLARESGGVFSTFSSSSHTVDAIEKWLKKHDENLMSQEANRGYFELFFLPLFLALVLFFLSSTHFVKRVVILLALVGVNVEAEELLTKGHWGKGEEKIEQSSWALFDGFKLEDAYESYEKKEYEESYKSLMQMSKRNFEAELLLAHVYYRLKAFKKARETLQKMKSNNVKVKQQLLYELGNCEAKLASWEGAKRYYIQALQLGEDNDTRANLAFVLFQKKRSTLKGIKENATASKSDKKELSRESEEEENSASKSSKSELGASGGGGNKKTKNATLKVQKSETNKHSKRQLSSKAYDLINKGYIREEKPW